MRTATSVLYRMHHIEIISRLEDQHLGYLRTLTDAATQADGHEPIGEHKFLRMKHGDDLALGMMALEGERLVGYAHTLTYETDGERRVSCELVVHPAIRRQGLGRRLLAEVIAHAERQRARVLSVWGIQRFTGKRPLCRGVWAGAGPAVAAHAQASGSSAAHRAAGRNNHPAVPSRG